MNERQYKIVNFLKRYFKEIIIALIFAFIAAIIIDSYREKSAEELLHQNQDAIVLIQTYKEGKPLAIGSGIFIDNQGTAVTNYHVLEGADDVEAKLKTGAFYRLKEIIGADKERDIAILKFNAQGTPYVNLGESANIKVGQVVYAIGSPLGLEGTVSEGVISYPERAIGNNEFIQFTAPISSGNSGGGLFDAKSGKVIGIPTLSINIPPEQQKEMNAQNLNFAVPIDIVKDSLSGKSAVLTQESPAYYYSLGSLAENEHDFDKAAEYYKKTIELDDKFADAYLGLGGIYYEKGNYELEASNYLKATQLDSNNYEYFYYLATAYEDEGMFDKAVGAYENALTIKPDDKDSLHDLSLLYFAIGKKDKAIKLLPQLVKLDKGWGEELRLILGL